MKTKAVYDVVLVSAFGRLDPLAIELVQRGMSVGLVDLTKAFRHLSWRDLNGPFPMVNPSPALPSHLDWLGARSSTELDRGFAMWLRSGPLELRGSLGTFYAEKHLEVALLKDYLARVLQTPKSQTVFNKFYRDLPFKENWLIHLSHALTQRKMTLHCRSANEGQPFPLHQSVQILRLDDRAINDLKSAAINAGVDDFESSALHDVFLDHKQLDQVEIEKGTKLRGHFFVWGLQQEESHYLSPKVFETLFNTQKPVLSDWVWRRLALESNEEIFKAFPESFLMIQNPEWSWSNENFVLFKKDQDGHWDLWMRTPRVGFDGQVVAQKVEDELRLRVGDFKGQVIAPSAPDVFSYSLYETISPSQLPKIRMKNVLFEGSEDRWRLDLAARFENQVGLLAQLETLKQKLDKQMLKRGGVIDQQIHSP